MIKLVVFDFDGCFTDNKVYVSEDGKESVRCCRSDGVGIKMLRSVGIEVHVLTQEINRVIARRCEKLLIPYTQCSGDKINYLGMIRCRDNFDADIPTEVAYFGNDLNDLECLQAVGLPGCPSDAHPQVLGYCLTNGFVATAKGGDGAVREFCEYILEANG